MNANPKIKITQPPGTKGNENHRLFATMNRRAMDMIGSKEVVFSFRKMTIRAPIFLEEKRFSVQSNGLFTFSSNSKEDVERLLGEYELEKDGDDYLLQKIEP